MACDSKTLQALVESNGYDSLSDRDVLICLASAIGSKAIFANAQAGLTQAYADGLAKLSERDLLICLASIYNSGSSQTALNTAASNGMAKVASSDLPQMLLTQVC